MIDARREDLLQRALDGETTAEESAELQQALVTDADLRARHDELTAVVSFLAAAEPVLPPADLRDAIVSRVRVTARPAATTEERNLLRRFLARFEPGYGYAFATGAVLALAVSWLPAWRPAQVDPTSVPGAMLPPPVSQTLEIEGATATVQVVVEADGTVIRIDLQSLREIGIDVVFAADRPLVAFERGPESPGFVASRAGEIAFPHRGRDRVRIVLGGPAGEIRVHLVAGGDRAEAVFGKRP